MNLSLVIEAPNEESKHVHTPARGLMQEAPTPMLGESMLHWIPRNTDRTSAIRAKKDPVFAMLPQLSTIS